MKQKTKNIAVIMAGGQGERFWPQSRKELPKQFLSLTGDDRTLFQLTVERMLLLCGEEDIFVVTNEKYKGIIRNQVPGIPLENILCEPVARNTAPALAFAAGVIQKRYGDATLLIVPSDHIISNVRLFADIMSTAAEFAAKEEALVTLGVTPTYPETGYGYIRYGDAKGQGIYKVEGFVEKPDFPIAEKYLAAGNYLWNSGMFIWRTSTFFQGLQKHSPSMAALTEQITRATGAANFEETIKVVFEEAQSISIDYALMEKASNIYTLPANFSWNDVGSWNAIDTVNPLDEKGNVQVGKVLCTNCENSVFFSNGRLVAAVGVENLVVVETPDAVMVCEKSNAQDVKQLVTLLRQKSMGEYL